MMNNGMQVKIEPKADQNPYQINLNLGHELLRNPIPPIKTQMPPAQMAPMSPRRSPVSLRKIKSLIPLTAVRYKPKPSKSDGDYTLDLTASPKPATSRKSPRVLTALEAMQLKYGGSGGMSGYGNVLTISSDALPDPKIPELSPIGNHPKTPKRSALRIRPASPTGPATPASRESRNWSNPGSPQLGVRDRSSDGPAPIDLPLRGPPTLNNRHLSITFRLNGAIKRSMEDFRDMTDRQLANVRDFCIAHKEFGYARWLMPVDVRGLALEKVVKFNSKSIEVYPSDCGFEKPQRGGLNQPARVVLFGCFSKKAGPAKYAEKLKRHCSRNSLKFVDYNVQTQEWSFEVLGF